MKQVYLANVSSRYSSDYTLVFQNRNDAVRTVCACHDCNVEEAASYIKALPYVADPPMLAPYIGGGGCGYIVDCDKCWSKTGYYSQRDQAIEAWNTRAERTCHNISRFAGARFACSACDFGRDWDPALYEDYGVPMDFDFNYCPNCGEKVVVEE